LRLQCSTVPVRPCQQIKLFVFLRLRRRPAGFAGRRVEQNNKKNTKKKTTPKKHKNKDNQQTPTLHQKRVWGAGRHLGRQTASRKKLRRRFPNQILPLPPPPDSPIAAVLQRPPKHFSDDGAPPPPAPPPPPSPPPRDSLPHPSPPHPPPPFRPLEFPAGHLWTGALFIHQTALGGCGGGGFFCRFFFFAFLSSFCAFILFFSLLLPPSLFPALFPAPPPTPALKVVSAPSRCVGGGGRGGGGGGWWGWKNKPEQHIPTGYISARPIALHGPRTWPTPPGTETSTSVYPAFPCFSPTANHASHPVAAHTAPCADGRPRVLLALRIYPDAWRRRSSAREFCRFPRCRPAAPILHSIPWARGFRFFGSTPPAPPPPTARRARQGVGGVSAAPHNLTKPRTQRPTPLAPPNPPPPTR